MKQNLKTYRTLLLVLISMMIIVAQSAYPSNEQSPLNSEQECKQLVYQYDQIID